MLPRKFLQRIPEIYFFIAILALGYTPPFQIAGISVILSLLILIQMWVAHPLSGVVIAGSIALAQLLFALALIPAYQKAVLHPDEGQELLIGGLGLLAVNLFFLAWMMYNNITQLIRPAPEPAPMER
jgi:hypothetical protein